LFGRIPLAKNAFPDENKRASHFHFPIDRQRFVASRALLRTILGAYLIAGANDVSFSYSDKEKPSLRSVHADSGITFNVSHSGRIALYAFTRRREIGVDVEQVRRDFDVEAIARRFFSPREQRQLADFCNEERVDAFFRCWTRKEAYIKATGKGLSLPLAQFDVSLGAVKKTRCLRLARMVQKQDVGFSAKCREDLAILPLSASAVKIGN